MTRILLFLAGALALTACDDDSPTGSTTTSSTTTTTAPQSPTAIVALSVARVEPELSPVEGKLYRLTWFMTLTESAGVGARINFLRQEIWNRDFDKYERTEIGGDEVAGICGTNRLDAGASWECRVPFDFNLDNFQGLIRITVTLYDDFDHLVVVTVNVPLSEPELRISTLGIESTR